MIGDFMIIGKDFQWKGTGGILGAGFWGNYWEFRPDISYMFC